MELILVLLAVGAILLFAAGFGTFRVSFREKFGRSFVHWQNIAAVALLILGFALMSGSEAWEAVYYIAWALLIGLGIWQIRRYGFGWGIGVWAYNVLVIALVISVINAISNMLKDNNK